MSSGPSDLDPLRTGPSSGLADPQKTSLGDPSSTPSSAPDLPELEGYDLVERLGHGGMGVVYEAYQQSTGRRVAIKFMLDSSLASETARRRFEREVELVARLQHPHIVSVIDSGLQRGRYYYVMEHIEGTSLDRWRPPSIEDALRLMTAICDAVDHAHQRGVLHRDLKPSNILIDAQGAPHLLDFGLAKLLSEDSPIDRAATLSEPGQILGTLAYMSPEQFRGAADAAGVRSDIYSLGAIAYELITSRLPIDVDGPIDEVAQRVLLRDPPPPSSCVGTSTGRLGVSLTDLDAIVLKSLEKNPQRRYGAARELADDLRRCLVREIVSARRAGTLTRLIRWTQRRRGMAATVAIAAALVLSTAVISFIRVTREKNRAEDAARKLAAQVDEVTRVLAFTQSMIERTAQESAHLRDITPLLAMLADAENRIPTELTGHLEAEAALRRSIGKTYQNLGRLDDAEKNLLRALALRRERFGNVHQHVISSLHDLAWLKSARSDPAAAVTACEEAVALARRLHGDESPRMVDVLQPLAYALQNKGDLDRAETTWRDVLARWKRYHSEPDHFTADLSNSLASIHERRSDLPGAERLYREALEINRRVAPRGDLQTAMILGNLANVVSWRDFAAGEKLLRESLAILRRDQGDADLNVLRCWNTLAANLMQQGRYGAARTEYQNFLAAHERSGRAEDEPLAFALCNLGSTTFLDGDYQPACDLFNRASTILGRVHGTPTADDVGTISNHAAALEALGKYEEAEVLARKALDTVRGFTDRREYYEAQSLVVLASIRHSRGDDPDAERLYRRALEINQRLPQGGGADTGVNLSGLAQVLTARGDPSAAVGLLRQAIEILQQRLSKDHLYVGVATVYLAAALRDQGRYDEAETTFEKATTSLKKQLAPDHPSIAHALFEWGRLRHRRGDTQTAKEKWSEALRIREQRLPPQHPDIALTRAALQGRDAPVPAATQSASQ